MKTLIALLLLTIPLHAQEVRWNDKADFANRNDKARQVFISGDYVVSIGQPSISPATDCAVRTYDKLTGTLLWTDQQAATGTSCVGTVFQNRVYITMDRAVGLYKDAVIRALDIPTGNLLWERTINTGKDDRIVFAAASSSLVAVTGYGYNVLPGEATHGSMTVYTLDGDLLLQQDLGLLFYGWAVSVDNQANVALVGHEETNSDWTTRVYNLQPALQTMRRAERQAARAPRP